MKKLSLSLLIVLMAAGSVMAHNGSLGIYTDETASDCDVAGVPYVPTDVDLVYYKSDGGPDGITAIEFQLYKSNPAIITVLGATWPAGSITLGTLDAGISVSFSCMGAGQDLVWVGTLQVMLLGAPGSAFMQIIPDPTALDPSSVYVSKCGDKEIMPVLGGFFSFTDGSCNIAAESTTWGAIKSMMYND